MLRLYNLDLNLAFSSYPLLIVFKGIAVFEKRTESHQSFQTLNESVCYL